MPGLRKKSLVDFISGGNNSLHRFKELLAHQGISLPGHLTFYFLGFGTSQLRDAACWCVSPFIRGAPRAVPSTAQRVTKLTESSSSKGKDGLAHDKPATQVHGSARTKAEDRAEGTEPGGWQGAWQQQELEEGEKGHGQKHWETEECLGDSFNEWYEDGASNPAAENQSIRLNACQLLHEASTRQPNDTSTTACHAEDAAEQTNGGSNHCKAAPDGGGGLPAALEAANDADSAAAGNDEEATAAAADDDEEAAAAVCGEESTAAAAVYGEEATAAGGAAVTGEEATAAGGAGAVAAAGLGLHEGQAAEQGYSRRGKTGGSGWQGVSAARATSAVTTAAASLAHVSLSSAEEDLLWVDSLRWDLGDISELRNANVAR